jgi:hypothetical protein
VKYDGLTKQLGFVRGILNSSTTFMSLEF